MLFGAVGRSFSPSKPDQFAGHQHDAERRRPGERPAELEPAGGAGYPHTSLQSVLELDCTHQIHGAIQEEKEKDHPRGNLVSVFLHFPFFSAPVWRVLSRIISAQFSVTSTRKCKHPLFMYTRTAINHAQIDAMCSSLFNPPRWWRIFVVHRRKKPH